MPSNTRTGPVREAPVPISGSPSIVLLRGGRMGHIHPLLSEVRIGRDETNTIVLDQTSVSRFHARLFNEGQVWFVTDAGSRNGTYLNDELVQGEARLASGDLLKLGDAIFKYLEGNDVESSYHEEIYRLTIIDPLTELHNRRYLLELLSREISRAARYERPLSVVVMDLDHFKKVNDTFGHVAGDHVLRSVARLVSEKLREEELATRYGGEEFVFVLPETSEEQARVFAERLRTLLEGREFVFEDKPMRTTASFGVVTLTGACTPETLIKAADEQLYRAKERGRNRVVSPSDP
jgi:diguanylate cyclase (GGDEF)-like protein